MKEWKTIPFLFLISNAFAFLEECYNEVEKLHIKENGLLLQATKDMLQIYNETCGELKTCDYYVDPQSMDYISSMTMDTSIIPDLPDVPMKGSIQADLKSIEINESYQNFKYHCHNASGKVCTVKIELALEGLALESIDVDVSGDIENMPLCLVDECMDDDMTKLADLTMRKMLLSQLDIDEKHREMIYKLDIPTACLLVGLDKCDFEIIHDCESNTHENPEPDMDTMVSELNLKSYVSSSSRRRTQVQTMIFVIMPFLFLF